MSNLIVLELPFWAEKKWFNDDIFEDLISLVPCAPVFNRKGLYIWRKNKKVILECDYGTFDYSTRYDDCVYDLMMLQHIPLSNKDFDALKSILYSKDINEKYKKQLRTLYTNEKQRRYHRKLEVDAKKIILDIRRKSGTSNI